MTTRTGVCLPAIVLLAAFWLVPVHAGAQETVPTPLAAEGASGEIPPAAEETAEGSEEESAAPPRTPGEPVSQAVAGPADAIRQGGAAAAEQGRSLWEEALLPMWQRFAGALPSTLRAVLLLLGFWIAAVLAGAGVRKLLLMTDLDNRAMRDLGLEALLKTEKGELRSIESLAGSIVKWVILLFGLVAFFQALELEMVGGPLQKVVDRVFDLIPSLLQAGAILIAYWVVATLVKLGITRGLGLVKFDERAGRLIPSREVRGEQLGPSALVGRLFFFLILLFGLPPFLEALGQQSLVEPLSQMLETGLGFLPNVVAALILFFLGRVIASLVREVVTGFVASTGLEASAERLEVGKALGERKLSEVLGAVAYFFIIIPILVAAVDSLRITAISDPVKRALGSILEAVPLLFVAAVLILVGYFIAKTVRGLVESFLASVGIDAVPEKIGLAFLRPREGQAPVSRVAGWIVMMLIVLMTAQQAAATVGLMQLAGMVGALLGYLPRLFAGLLIILASLSLGAYVARLVDAATAGAPHAALLATVARYAVVFLGVSMGLSQLGVAGEIITVAVAAVMGGAALALGLAFGLGGRDRAKELVERGGAQNG